MSPEAVSPRQAIRQFLASLRNPARILVAISGGSDSTGLLLLLDEAVKAAPHLDISLCAATIDHALRAGSADEAREVATLCACHGIPHIVSTWQGEKPKAGIMAAAREVRYSLLAEAAEALNADLIVTGHTLDDQRETLRMREMRTEQLSSGIADAVLLDRRFWILRPLLFSTRADIRTFLRERGVRWIDDPSNEDVRYERVRMRRQISAEPATEMDIRAAWEERLALSSRAAEWLNCHFRLHGCLLGQVTADGLRQDRAVLDYSLGRLTAVFGGQQFVPGGAQLERLLSFAAGGRLGRMTLGRVVFDLRRDGLYLSRESRGIVPLVLQPGETGVWDGRFQARNGSTAPVAIEAAATHSASLKSLGSSPRTGTGEHHFGHLPKAAWKRAIASAPVLSVAGAPLFQELASGIDLTPYFAPFDRFLTRFDFIFADRLSAVFAMAPYAGLPLRSIDGKTI
ncbi:tRNA lysidine(34) synthetase TilS [Rhizobium sp. MHM7A]|uniref:tRNA lysidine(34) synthetase TilS n=1 Tax=Rhizobium sp. MHM7A TaxID=2583233 RepID=UPI0011074E2F|nr:tRNA lysidine(34) synthetase TilS [Rhizobium sp. MHM7A]TLX10165.1 tRNA lysidine(34) synthetase TilS [Rhizobium sp. MHM7A]